MFEQERLRNVVELVVRQETLGENVTVAAKVGERTVLQSRVHETGLPQVNDVVAFVNDAPSEWKTQGGMNLVQPHHDCSDRRRSSQLKAKDMNKRVSTSLSFVEGRWVRRAKYM